MKTLRIIGVPEHFNYPFRLLERDQPFKDHGIHIQWIDESRGSGQMNLALRNDEADIAILLTESFLKDVEAGNPSKMIGYHVETPLVWGIHIGFGSDAETISTIDKKHFLVSRMGSGSHLMALALAKREGWKPEELTFEIIGNMDGAKAAMVLGNEGIFLWEKYTTAPMVKNGTMKRIGEIPSPWPCFLMAASESAVSKFGNILTDVRAKVYELSRSIWTIENRASLLANYYDLDQHEVEKWLNQTRWCTEAKVSVKELTQAMQTMKELGILQNELKPDLFILPDGILLVD